MIKLKIYLDTSVISHLQQEDVPEKMQETLELWEQFKERKDIEVIIIHFKNLLTSYLVKICQFVADLK